jgi:hypothetical protein
MSARPRIRVINPNANEAVTRNLDAALEPLRFDGGPEIVCSTLAEGPFGIETQVDVESVVMPLRRFVEADNATAPRPSDSNRRAPFSLAEMPKPSAFLALL